MSAASPLAAYRKVAFEARVVAADPAELTAILLDELADALATTRRATEAGRLAERSAALTRSLAVLTLLARGLDREGGGEVAASFGRWCEGLSAAVLARTLRWEASAFDPLVDDARGMVEAWGTAREVSRAA